MMKVDEKTKSVLDLRTIETILQIILKIFSFMKKIITQLLTRWVLSKLYTKIDSYT